MESHGRLAEIDNEEHREGYEYYQKFVAGPRSLTPMELHMIPKLVDTHGLAEFTKASFAAANKANLSSPIRYIEVTLAKWAEEGQRAVIDKVFNLDEPREAVEPASKERDLAVLEQKAREGNEFAQALLRGRGRV